MEVFIMVGQLILGLSILVGLHELGHLLAAKAFGMRVEQFSIGFPPKIWGKKFGDTEYSVGMIPLGGFVKISGMIDESLDVTAMRAAPQPHEFRSKPAWQRLIVMMGGIIVNVILGIVIFIGFKYTQGDTYLSKQELNKYGIVAYELGESIGFKTGDKILDINGEDYERFRDLVSPAVLLSSDGYFTVDRDGKRLTIPIPNDFVDAFAEENNAQKFIFYRLIFDIGAVIEGSPADLGGLQIGDKIIALNGAEIEFYDQLQASMDTLAATQITLLINRSNFQKTLTIEVNEEGKIGFQANRLNEISTIEYTFAESIPLGTELAFSIVWDNIKGFKKIFAGEVSASKSLSGPIGIAKIFGGTWDWQRFWRITGMLSMVLAFMNFLPIPALDGGHVVFLTWEIVTGKKPSDIFLENAQKVGMILLLALMSYAILNDIIKLF
ncbi:MAG: RIP metalloprotease RseP [Cyclobacteriaceae bacterium]|jgi:regulator of sigma E protease|nr:RIP metalloprotease RseP [Cyclobacteriaceae bacterium]